MDLDRLADELEPQILAAYRQGLGQVEEPLVVVFVKQDETRIVGIDRTAFLKTQPSPAKLTQPAKPGWFWLVVVDTLTGHVHACQSKPNAH